MRAGTGFPEYSTPNWTQPWATCSWWPCIEQGDLNRLSPEVPPNLSFYAFWGGVLMLPVTFALF